METPPTPERESESAASAQPTTVQFHNWTSNRGAQGLFYGPVTIKNVIPRLLVVALAAAALLGILSAAAGLVIGYNPLERQLKTWNVLPQHFGPEQSDETLILVVPFFRTQGVIDSDAQHEIAEAIRTQAAEVLTGTVRAEEMQRDGFRAEDQQTARRLASATTPV